MTDADDVTLESLNKPTFEVFSRHSSRGVAASE